MTYTQARQDLEKRNGEAKHLWNCNVQKMHYGWQYSELLDILYYRWQVAESLHAESDYKNEFLAGQVEKYLCDYEGTKAAIKELSSTETPNYTVVSVNGKSGPAFDEPVFVGDADDYGNYTTPGY